MDQTKRRKALQEDSLNQKNMESESSSEGNMEEEYSEADAFEEYVRDEARTWLANAGRAMFALECQRFLVNERKRKDVKTVR